MVDINKKEKEKERSVLVEMAAKAQLSSRTNQRLFIHSLFSLLSLSLSLSMQRRVSIISPAVPNAGLQLPSRTYQKKIRKTTTKKEERERKEYKKRGEGSGGGRGGGGGGGGRMWHCVDWIYRLASRIITCKTRHWCNHFYFYIVGAELLNGWKWWLIAGRDLRPFVSAHIQWISIQTVG